MSRQGALTSSSWTTTTTFVHCNDLPQQQQQRRRRRTLARRRRRRHHHAPPPSSWVVLMVLVMLVLLLRCSLENVVAKEEEEEEGDHSVEALQGNVTSPSAATTVAAARAVATQNGKGPKDPEETTTLSRDETNAILNAVRAEIGKGDTPEELAKDSSNSKKVDDDEPEVNNKDNGDGLEGEEEEDDDGDDDEEDDDDDEEEDNDEEEGDEEDEDEEDLITEKEDYLGEEPLDFEELDDDWNATVVTLTKENFVRQMSRRFSLLGSDNRMPHHLLVLIAFCAPRCTEQCTPLLETLEEIANHLLPSFRSQFHCDEDLENDKCAFSVPALDTVGHADMILTPLLAKVQVTSDNDDFANDDFVRYLGGDENKDPVVSDLKFVLVRQRRHANANHNDKGSSTVHHDLDILPFSFVARGSGTNPLEVMRSTLHFWYRHVVTAAGVSTTQEATLLDPNDPNSPVTPPPPPLTPPVFVVSSPKEAISLVETHGPYFLRRARQVLTKGDSRYQDYVHSLLFSESEATKFEPVTIFVQCRLHHKENPSLYREFNQLAETMIHRTDVAFVAIDTDDMEDPEKSRCFSSNTSTTSVDGMVHAWRLWHEEPSNDPKRWVGLGNDVADMPLYDPRKEEVKDDEEEEAAAHTLTSFVIVQSTPPVLWFDRTTSAAWAFPLYRKIHSVLFLNLHHVWSERTIRAENQVAVDRFREAAIRHVTSRREEKEDVVFLIVPSTEVKALTTFGFDIWTPLDECLVQQVEASETRDEKCSADAIRVLPSVMITFRIEHGTKSTTRRYYLPREQVLGEPNDNDESKNPVAQFLDDFSAGKLHPYVASQPDPESPSNRYGVQIVTGRTFQRLVMDKVDCHSLVFFYSPTCVHCKRFSILWNELSQLVQQLEWDGVVQVFKMDVTQNEVPEGIDVRDVPSVYYFPAKTKHEFLELQVEGDDVFRGNNVGGISDVYDIVEWMLQQNRMNDAELLRLAETKA